MKRILVVFVLMTMMVSCDFLLPQPVGGTQEAYSDANDIYYNSVNNEENGPWNYQEALEDVARYKIALCNYVINSYNDLTASYWDIFINRIDEFDNYMDNRWLEETNDTGYLNVLVDVSDMPDHMYNVFASKVLQEYYNTSVILSDYRQIKTSSNTRVWEFYEINTRIKFRFTLDPNWDCSMDDDSALRYINKYLY